MYYNINLENYKLLMNETKDDLNQWMDIPCSLMRRLSMTNMPILPKSIHILNVLPLKTTEVLVDIDKATERTKYYILPAFKTY